MINRVNEDYYHYLMYVVYDFDKQDTIILNHHYRRYFHLEKKIIKTEILNITIKKNVKN